MQVCLPRIFTPRAPTAFTAPRVRGTVQDSAVVRLRPPTWFRPSVVGGARGVSTVEARARDACFLQDWDGSAPPNKTIRC
jgi:hypothetical protein